jgi:Helix-turn-helix.
MKKQYEFSEKEIGMKIKSIMIVLGENIKKKRIEKNISRTELAYDANTTEGMICNIENGKKLGITIYTLVKISNALETTAKELFCE